MLSGLTPAANASHYWAGSWFDVASPHTVTRWQPRTPEMGGWWGGWVREVDVLSRVICVFIWEMQQYVSVWVPDERFAKKKKREERRRAKKKKDRATQMIVKEENGGVIKKKRARGVSWLGPSFVLKEGRGGGGGVGEAGWLFWSWTRARPHTVCPAAQEKSQSGGSE